MPITTTKTTTATPVSFVDAHSVPARPSQADGVVRYEREDGKVFFCPYYNQGNFCLNKFTVSRDGGLRLSPTSVGPTVSFQQVLLFRQDGELQLAYGGKLTMASEEEALEHLRSAKVINKVLRDIEDEFDICLHEFKL